MDLVVADIPPRFGMLLSRSWGAKLRGTLQLDLSYATISDFGQLRKLYEEKKIKYMITSKEKPNNHAINVVHIDLDSFILFNDSGLNDVDSHLIEVEEITEIFNSVKVVLDEKQGNQPSYSNQSSDKSEKGSEHTEEVA